MNLDYSNGFFVLIIIYKREASLPWLESMNKRGYIRTFSEVMIVRVQLKDNYSRVTLFEVLVISFIDSSNECSGQWCSFDDLLLKIRKN